MIRPADPAAWREFKRRLPTGRDLHKVQLPVDLPYQGTIGSVVDYVPRDLVLQALRAWIAGTSQTEVLYFLTECATGEPSEFVISLSSLRHDDLAAINVGRENVFASVKGDWAVFIEHEGALHVAGPSDLLQVLTEANR